MKRFIFLMIFFALGKQGFAQTDAEKKDIQAPVIRFFEALSAVNEQALKAEVTSEFSSLENGKVWNTDSLTNSMNRYKGLDIKRINHLDFIKTEKIGIAGWVSYYNTADLTYKGRQIIVRWLESAVLEKEKGQWKIKLLHSTELKPVVEPPKKN